MPRAKKTTDSASSESLKKTKAPKKAATKKKAVKKTPTIKKSKDVNPSKKAKPVIVDVIEDDVDFVSDDTFFSDASLAEKDDSSYPGADKKTATKNVETDDVEDIEIDGTEFMSEEDEGEEESDETTEADWGLEDDAADGVDKQKQFFSDLVSDMKNKQQVKARQESDGLSEEEAAARPRKSVGLYRRLAWKFLILVGFLVLLVFYVSFSKLTVLITPQVEAMNDTIFLKVSNDSGSEAQLADAREKVSGSVYEVQLEVEKIYQTTGEEFLNEEVSGRVTIINNNNKAQALVATTRILATDGKLFRLKEAVNVPAGGQIEAEVYADKISAEMAIGPSRFTIPGLWIGLQDKIYAESKTAFTYQQKIQKIVKASDIQLANSEASTLILAKAREIKPLRAQDKLLYKIQEPINIELGVKVGDKVEDFRMKATATVVAVSFSQEEVLRLARAKLNILVPDDKEFVELQSDSLSYVLENYNETDGLATIKASFSGQMVLKSNADIIDRERLVNLNAEQISTYLRDYPEIGNYELEFYPSFVKKAPHLVDRIEIKIRK